MYLEIQSEREICIKVIVEGMSKDKNSRVRSDKNGL